MKVRLSRLLCCRADTKYLDMSNRNSVQQHTKLTARNSTEVQSRSCAGHNATPRSDVTLLSDVWSDVTPRSAENTASNTADITQTRNANNSARKVTFEEFDGGYSGHGHPDTWLELNEAFSYSSLVRAVENTIQKLIPNVVDTYLFLLTPDTGDVELYGGAGCLGKLLPASGIIPEALKGDKPHITTHVTIGATKNDPLYTLLDTSKNVIREKTSVIIIPLKREPKCYGCFIMVTDASRKPALDLLALVQKYVVAAAARVVEHETEKYAHVRSDKMLNFCVGLYQMNSVNLIENILKHVLETTDAMFTALMVPDIHEQELNVHLYDGGFQLENITIDLEASLFGHLIVANKPNNLVNVFKDPRFNTESDTLTGREVQTLICLPITCDSKTQSMICAFNKRGLQFNSFTKGDEEKMAYTMNYCAPILSNALTFEQQLSSRERTQALLKVAQNLFTRFDSVNVLLREIMQEARTLTQAESCSVFLVDKMTNELVAKVFDGTLVDGDIGAKGHEIRIPINKGIAGHVAMTGKLLNIKDAYSHPLFYRGVDEDTGFVTRNILCFPIKDDCGVIGIAQLCNKTGGHGKYFTRHDEEAALSFSVYCGISISNSLLFKKVQDAQYRSKLASNLMIYHMQVPQPELESAMAAVQINTKPPPLFHSLLFPTYILDEESQTVSLAYHMFLDLGLISRWNIVPQTLIRFLLMVKRGYRDPPYHNWMHAFCVGHFFYAICKAIKFTEYFSDVETLSMLMACFCHDLDHRGTTNSFQVASRSVLACLYSSEGSVMERHHFAQTVCILDNPGCNIMDGMSTVEYKQGLDTIQKIILATDLAHHLKIISQQKEMAAAGYDISNEQHHFLLLSLVVTSCDLSVNVKLFEESSVIIRDHIYTEFFSEGDMQKELGQTPQTMNDRQKACIPSLQLKFNDFIAAPLYRLLVDVFPTGQLVVDQLDENRSIWDGISVKHSLEENHNCVKYDTYISCEQSRKNIEKELSDYATKLTSRRLQRTESKFKEFDKMVQDWNNTREAGDCNRTKQHVNLISDYNKELQINDTDQDLTDMGSGRALSLKVRKSSDDTALKRKLYLSHSEPPSSASPPRCRSTPNTPRGRTTPKNFHQTLDEDVFHEKSPREHTLSPPKSISPAQTSPDSLHFRSNKVSPECSSELSRISPLKSPTLHSKYNDKRGSPEVVYRKIRTTSLVQPESSPSESFSSIDRDSIPDHHIQTQNVHSLLSHGKEEWI